MNPKKAGGNAGFGKEGGQFFHLNRNEAGNKEQSEPVIKASRRSGVCVGVCVHTCGVCVCGVCAHVCGVCMWVCVVCVCTHTCTTVQGKGSRGILCIDHRHGLNG